MAYGAAGTTITGSPPACRAYSSVAFSHNSSGNWLAVTLDTNRFDPTGMHSTSTNTSRITITSPGVYLLTGAAEFTANATGVRGLSFRINGATFIAADNRPATAAGAAQLTVATLWKFVATDYVELMATQSSGGTLSMTSGSAYSPEFAACWMALGT